ncbi:BMC domain-containing protein [Desulfocurvus sp. DL9XJH121]
MASHDALGFVEVMGMAAAIEVSDVMVKTAWVNVKTVCNADAGLLSVVCEGELAACKASVDAGAAAAQAMGALLRTNLIPRPAEGLETLVMDYADSVTTKPQPVEEEAAPVAKPAAKPKGKGGKK